MCLSLSRRFRTSHFRRNIGLFIFCIVAGFSDWPLYWRFLTNVGWRPPQQDTPSVDRRRRHVLAVGRISPPIAVGLSDGKVVEIPVGVFQSRLVAVGARLMQRQQRGRRVDHRDVMT